MRRSLTVAAPIRAARVSKRFWYSTESRVRRLGGPSRARGGAIVNSWQEHATSHADVLVVGGGPAGLAAAIAARLQGLDVTLMDAARPPIDKACGEGILPAGIDALARLGVTLSEADGYAFHGIRFLSGEQSIELPFQAARGIAVRRTRLHEILVNRAAALGVRLVWGRRPGNRVRFFRSMADRRGWAELSRPSR